MAMSKQDFTALADAIRLFYDRQDMAPSTALIRTSGKVAAAQLTQEIADYLAKKYPAFNRSLWLSYIFQPVALVELHRRRLWTGQ